MQAAAEGLVDFQPDVTHEVVPENKRRKKLFEGLYLEGRPPINVGVTSSGNFFGGTPVALTDVLGDQLFSFTVLSVSSYRIYDGRYTNLASRLHYGVNVFDQTYFFYPYYAQYAQYYGQDPRDLAIATQRFTGGQVFAEYPLDTFRRARDSASASSRSREQYGDEQRRRSWSASSRRSRACPASSTTAGRLPSRCASSRRRPASPSSARSPGARSPLGVTAAPRHRRASCSARRWTPTCASTSASGPRARCSPCAAAASTRPATTPTTSTSAATWRCGATRTTASPATRASSPTPSSALPLINLAATPIGIIGPAAGHDVLRDRGRAVQGPALPVLDAGAGLLLRARTPIFGEPVTGWRLVDGRASWGFGLQLFFLGYPMHFDWTKFTDFATTSKGWDFGFWIGYDF